MDDQKLTSYRSTLSRAGIAGAILAVVGILLFILIYGLLSDADQLPRLLVSLCVPPAIMAALVGAYLIVSARKNP